MHSPGLNRPSQESHCPVCHYLLQVSPNPGLTLVTAESDQYLWISTLSFLPGYRRSTRNITVSFYWDDGPLLGYSLALPLALWLLCSCGAFHPLNAMDLEGAMQGRRSALGWAIETYTCSTAKGWPCYCVEATCQGPGQSYSLW